VSMGFGVSHWLAFQDIFKNFFGRRAVAIERAVSFGRSDNCNFEGTIENITIRSTQIKTLGRQNSHTAIVFTSPVRYWQCHRHY